ncbi:short transient receptor potential channel 4-like [Ptychodera flava]|uniref:short transient receptor potential channel 4-like n=1 Tax=Ptychodera flava TaxID=63121 RepID=UPI00396AA692
MAGRNDTFEKLYLAAVEKGDIQAAEFALMNPGSIDINAKDIKGRSAIELAIKGRHAEILQLLLQNGVAIGDGLLYAVEADFYQGVHIICEFVRQDKDYGQAIINSRAEGEDFHPDITPIILAAHQNSYDIIKLLLHYKSYIEDPADGSYVTKRHTLQHSLGMLNVFRALSSEAYISLTEEDPIDRAFKLSVRLREASHREYEFRQEYLDLSKRCEEFAADLLGQTRNTDEQTVVLTHHEKVKYLGSHGMTDGLPLRAFQAVEMQQKKFVAHPHCQQLMVEYWYADLKSWRHKSLLETALYSLAICVGFPFLSVAYLLFPLGSFGRFMRIPYVKFLMYLASFITFLVILYLTSEDIGRGDSDYKRYFQEFADSKLNKDTITKLFNLRRGRRFDVTELFIIAWIAGMTWREVKEVWWNGFHRYLTDAWNTMDFAMIALFWCWFSLRIVSYFIEKRKEEIYYASLDRRDLNDTIENSTVTAPYTAVGTLDAFGSVAVNVAANDTNTLIVNEHIETRRLTEQLIDNMAAIVVKNLTEVIDQNSCAATIMNLTTILTTYIRQSTQTTSAQDRSTNYQNYYFLSPREFWNQWDPTLVSELLFSLASVLSVLRLMQMVVISEFVGPMQISLTKMVYDILRFLFIFALVWLAFSLGMTQIYWSYSAGEQLVCIQQGKDNCSDKAFGSIQQSMATLFWSLFGLSELSNLKVDGDHKSTEEFGMVLYAFYYVIAVVVLLNLIIAVMSNTYTRIEENADTEWKFSRTEMWIGFFKKGSVLPPPFNAVPSLKSVCAMFRSVYYVMCRKAGRKRSEKRKEKTKQKVHEYQRVVRQLTLRYFAEKRTSLSRESDVDGAIGVGFVNFKDDMSAFRFDLYESIRRVEETLSLSKTENLRMFERILKMQEALCQGKLDETDAINELQQKLAKDSEEEYLKMRLLEDRHGGNQYDKRKGGSRMFKRMAVELDRVKGMQPIVERDTNATGRSPWRRENETRVTPEDTSRETAVGSHVVHVHNDFTDEDDEGDVRSTPSTTKLEGGLQELRGDGSETGQEQRVGETLNQSPMKGNAFGMNRIKYIPPPSSSEGASSQRNSEDEHAGTTPPMYKLFEKLISDA